MPDVARLGSMELEIDRLRFAVSELERELEQVKAERDAFMLECQQQWEAIHDALASRDSCV